MDNLSPKATYTGVPGYNDKRTTFERWVEDTLKLDRHTGYFAGPLGTMPLKPWVDRGFDAAFVDTVGAESLAGMYVGEIAPGKSSIKTRQLYDEFIYIMSGTGSVTIIHNGVPKSFEWGPRSLFAIPMNAPFQIHNGSGVDPVRFISVNTLPMIYGMFRDTNFIYGGSDWDFKRIPDEGDITDSVLYEPDVNHERTAVNLYETLFVPDILTLGRSTFAERGEGAACVYMEMANSVISAHVCEVPANKFFWPHRHGPSGYVFTIEGTGYSMMWSDQGDMQRFEWPQNDVGLLVPPNMWWHGHFAVGKQNAVQLAIKLMSRVNSISHLYDKVHKPVSEGGAVLRFEDLGEEVRRQVWQPYVEAARKEGFEVTPPAPQKKTPAKVS